MQNILRGWGIVAAGAAGLSIAPEIERQIRKRGDLTHKYFIDHDHNALATARDLGFDTIELDWRGEFAARRIRAACAALGWEASEPEEPQGNPRALRPTIISNLPKLKRLLDRQVRGLGEMGAREFIILIVWGAGGPTSTTTGLVVASAVGEWKKEWKQRYPLLPIRKYGVEAIPLDFRQGNGLDANALTCYFSRLNRATLMEKGLFDNLFVHNGGDFAPAEPDDLTLVRFSRRLAAGVSHLLGLKVLETNTDDAMAFDYLEILPILPPQSNVCFFELGFPRVPDLRAIQAAGELVHEGECWTQEQRSVLGEICQEANLDTAPLDAWEQKNTMAVAPGWLIAMTAAIAVGGAVTSYLLTPWPWQAFGAAASLLVAGTLLGVVSLFRWHQKDRGRQEALHLLSVVFDNLIRECQKIRFIPPTFQPTFGGDVKDLLQKPLVELVAPADSEFTRARVQDFISGLVPEGTEVVHVITVADPTLVKAFGFTNADVAAMTGAKTACGYASEVPGLDFCVRYILIYGPVPESAMRGWSTYEVFGQNADGARERFDAWPEIVKAAGGK